MSHGPERDPQADLCNRTTVFHNHSSHYVPFFMYVCVSIYVNTQTPMFQSFFFLTSKSSWRLMSDDFARHCRVCSDLYVSCACLWRTARVCVYAGVTANGKALTGFSGCPCHQASACLEKAWESGCLCYIADARDLFPSHSSVYYFPVRTCNFTRFKQKKKKKWVRQRGGERIQDAIPNISKQYPEKSRNYVGH